MRHMPARAAVDTHARMSVHMSIHMPVHVSTHRIVLVVVGCRDGAGSIECHLATAMDDLCQHYLGMDDLCQHYTPTLFWHR